MLREQKKGSTETNELELELKFYGPVKPSDLLLLLADR